MLKKFILCIFFISISLLFPQEQKREPNRQIKFDSKSDIKLFHNPPEPLFLGRPF